MIFYETLSEEEKALRNCIVLPTEAFEKESYCRLQKEPLK